MDLGLKNKVALVTGAGSPRGMGRAIIEALAGEGVHIVASDIAVATPDPLMEMMGYAYGASQGLSEAVAAAKAKDVDAIELCADVSNPEDVEELVERAMRRGRSRRVVEVPAQDALEGAKLEEDRKSTRLNSSHRT